MLIRRKRRYFLKWSRIFISSNCTSFEITYYSFYTHERLLHWSVFRVQIQLNDVSKYTYLRKMLVMCSGILHGITSQGTFQRKLIYLNVYLVKLEKGTTVSFIQYQCVIITTTGFLCLIWKILLSSNLKNTTKYFESTLKSFVKYRKNIKILN